MSIIRGLARLDHGQPMASGVAFGIFVRPRTDHPSPSRRRRWKHAEQYTLRPGRAAKGTTVDSPQELQTTVERTSSSSRKRGATTGVRLSAWRDFRSARQAGQRLGAWKRPIAAKSRRSSSENANAVPQSRQVSAASVGCMAGLRRVRGVSRPARADATVWAVLSRTC